MTSQRYVCALSALLMTTSGCPGDDDDQASSDVGDTACASFSACGGDVVGTWTVEGVCADDVQDMFAEGFDIPECADAFRDFNLDPTGSITFTESGELSVSLDLSYEMSIALDSECIDAMAPGTTAEEFCPAFESQFSEALELVSSACLVQAGTCTCELSAQLDMLSQMTDYTVEGTELNMGGEVADYCVAGDVLRLTQPADDVLGSLVLTREN